MRFDLVMKELFLKYKKNYLNINCILLMLYFFFVFSTHVFVTIDSQVSILRWIFLK